MAKFQFTHACPTCKTKLKVDGDVNGFVFCDKCGRVLIPMDKTEKFQLFAAEVDSYLHQWTGMGLLTFDIELEEPGRETAEETALKILDKMRQDSTLDRFATQTVIYQDGETVWRFSGGQVLNYKPPAEWHFTMTYRLK